MLVFRSFSQTNADPGEGRKMTLSFALASRSRDFSRIFYCGCVSGEGHTYWRDPISHAWPVLSYGSNAQIADISGGFDEQVKST